MYYVISLAKVDEDKLKCVGLCKLSTYSEGEKDTNTQVSLPHLISANALAKSTEFQQTDKVRFWLCFLLSVRH